MQEVTKLTRPLHATEISTLLNYLFIAEQYKPGLEAELLWRFAYYISPLLLESAVSDGGKKPRAAQARPRTGNKPLLISWQKIHN